MTAPWQEVGDRIFRRRYESLDLNIGLVLTDDSTAVIDSRANHRQADELRAEIATVTRLPVKTLINTHYHWDHTFGNARFPEASIVAHEATGRALSEHGHEVRRRLVAEWVPADDRPLFEEVVIRGPDETFSGRLATTIGGRRLRLAHLGRGHTDSDIVIAVDDVLFAGDLVEQGAPPSFGDSFPREWIATLAELTPMIDRVVVPGHGDVVDREFVISQQTEMVRAVEAASREDLDAGPYPPEVMAVVASRLG